MLGRRDVSQPIHTPFPHIFWRDVRVICSRDGIPRGVREGEKPGFLSRFHGPGLMMAEGPMRAYAVRKPDVNLTIVYRRRRI